MTDCLVVSVNPVVPYPQVPISWTSLCTLRVSYANSSKAVQACNQFSKVSSIVFLVFVGMHSAATAALGPQMKRCKQRPTAKPDGAESWLQKLVAACSCRFVKL